LAFRRLFLLSVPFVTVAQLLTAQTVKLDPAPRQPQLTLEVIPLKKTYFVGETLFVKYKLTSLVDGTLFFPPPAVRGEQFFTGYLATVASSPEETEERDRFIESYWERHPSEEKLRSGVAEQWIKLGMSEPYQPKKAEEITVLKAPGEWVLQSTYQPPELSAHEKAIVESLGCTPSEVPIHSTLTITVMNPPR
jgi:hypothetical protein